MSTNNGNGFPPVKDQEDFKLEDLDKLRKVSISDVRDLLRRDLSLLIHLMEAIYKDENTFNTLADYLHGRMQNAIHRKELESQKDLFSTNPVN